MSAPNSVGTLKNISTLFNSGIITINGDQIGEVQNITLMAKQAEKNYYSLNSRLKRKVRAAQIDQNVSFEIEGGLYRDLFSSWFAQSSAVGSGLQYSPLDAQPSSPTMYFTCYENDDTTKAYQVTINGAVLLTHDITLAAQSFGKVKVEVACTSWYLYVDTAIAN